MPRLLQTSIVEHNTSSLYRELFRKVLSRCAGIMSIFEAGVQIERCEISWQQLLSASNIQLLHPVCRVVFCPIAAQPFSNRPEH